ncbi:hypothetical protein Aduo_000329 [Ancylostoma duodenale]
MRCYNAAIIVSLFIFTAFITLLLCTIVNYVTISSHYLPVEEQKFVALKPNHERLGNQLFQLASGFGIAKKLGRALYYPLNEAKTLRCYLKLLSTTFPRISSIYRILPKNSIKQTEVEFAFDEHGRRTCCRYDDPSRLIGHPAKYLLLQMSFAQNARYFEEYLPELRSLFRFSLKSHEQGNHNLRRLNVGNATDFMCAHIRRTDFLDFGIGSDLNSTLLATKDIASRKGLSKFLIFGDDKDFMRSLATQLVSSPSDRTKRIQTVRISEFSEIADLYISYRLCSAFLMSAASSTFGWWLAFFSQDQDSVYYYKDKRPTDDYKLLKDEFQLKSWHRYDG